MRRLILALLFSCAVGGALPSVASACPMCKAANESEKDNRKPQAYMYSILFMLAMPAVIFGGFGFGMYRLTKQQPRGPLPGEEGWEPEHAEDEQVREHVTTH